MSIRWYGLYKEVERFLGEAKEEVWILAPFIQPSSLTKIVPDNVPVTVATSWRRDHLLQGVSSLDTYEFCKAREQTRLFISERLHAKIFARDLGSEQRAALIGSANITERALGDGPDNNDEVVVSTPLSIQDAVEIYRIVHRARFVSDSIYNMYRTWLLEQPEPANGEDEETDFDPPGSSRFLTSHLPRSADPERLWEVANGIGHSSWWEPHAMLHDLALFNISPDLVKIEFLGALGESFREQPFIQAFFEAIDEKGMFFGRIKQWLQENCADVPAHLSPRTRGTPVRCR